MKLCKLCGKGQHAMVRTVCKCQERDNMLWHVYDKHGQPVASFVGRVHALQFATAIGGQARYVGAM